MALLLLGRGLKIRKLEPQPSHTRGRWSMEDGTKREAPRALTSGPTISGSCQVTQVSCLQPGPLPLATQERG